MHIMSDHREGADAIGVLSHDLGPRTPPLLPPMSAADATIGARLRETP